MGNTNVTLCLVDYGKAADFFISLSKLDKTRKYIILTHLPSVYIKCKKNKITSRLIHKLSKKSKFFIPVPDLQKTRELALGILTSEEAASLFRYYVNEIRCLEFKFTKIDYLFVWNGQTVAGEVCTFLRNEEKKKTLYFEIANINNRIFVDPWGVNSRSKLNICGEGYLRNFSDNSENMNYEEWKYKYIEDKRNASSIPQAKNLSEKNLSLLLDYMFTTAFGYKFFSKRSKDNKARVKKRKHQARFEEKELIKDFVFFPGQVHDDTQLILNSKIGNVEAIRKIVELENLPVIVKPHPAGSPEEYSGLSDLINHGRVIISYRNTFELIENAARIYTINSTVGFEAKLLGKEVIFFGRSLYEKFDRESLKNYVKNYLIVADFFSPEGNIPKGSIERIYLRADMETLGHGKTDVKESNVLHN
jgi:capsular polysaccharide export protein